MYRNKRYASNMDFNETEHGSLPPELKDRLTAFDESLTQLETSLEPLLSVPRNELSEKLPPLDEAKVDLLSAYALNSMFWMYLNTCGENPKSHSIKQELDRIRTYMGRVKEVQEKVKAPKLDKGASKRFVKNALWQAAHKPAKGNIDDKAKKVEPLDKEEEMKQDLKRKLDIANKGGDQRYYKEKKRKRPANDNRKT